MRTLYWMSAITILGSAAIAGCEVGGDAWPSSRGSGDGGAAPQLSTTSSASTGRPSATVVASTSTGAGSTAITTATGGPIPVPAADE
ncbi:MAG: hypothetical protein HOV80_14200 [Polyangiaceae bacterium]|nr:hypothetical protein [Polyangiaceae bacterium]